MIENKVIADKIEEIIGSMIRIFISAIPSANEYSIFYYPQKHATWFIIIFFADTGQLREAIKNGVCFQIHSYLVDKLKSVAEVSSIETSIFFESGKRPHEKKEIEDLFDNLLARINAIRENAGKADLIKCSFCGHDFNKHQLLKLDTASKGWIMCPEENCKCFQTWSLNAE